MALSIRMLCGEKTGRKRRNLYKGHFKASMARESEERGRKKRRQGGKK